MSLTIDLNGKTALVTGSGGGIGAAIAKVLGIAGANVIVSDVNPTTTEETAAQLNAQALPLDVTDSEAVDSAISQIVKNNGSLDIIVNNAGIYNGYGGPIVDLERERFHSLMKVNVDGVFYCSQAAARVMIKAGNGGRIINIASTQSVSPGVGVSYDSSKAAVLQMTRTLALELGKYDITANAVAPGATWVAAPGDPPPIDIEAAVPRTGEPLGDQVASRIARIPLGRWGKTEEIANVVAFVASPLASYVTGAYYNVDGGWLTL